MADWLFGLIDLVSKLWRWVVTWGFRQVFGRDAVKEYHIIYFIKDVQDRATIFTCPTPKRTRTRYASATNLTSIIPAAIARAMAHLFYSFGKHVKLPPAMKSDVETDERSDISFISLGGIGNLKTCDLLQEVSNVFEFKGESILYGTSTLGTAGNDVDCAFIIKVHPRSNPERTWLCCAGVGEWGTSGAAWFLARRWKDIRKWAKDRPFAIITKTTKSSDESTQPVHRFVMYPGASEFTKLT
jgi:hypothetical protein